MTVTVDRVDFTGLDEVLIEDILSLIKVNELMISVLRVGGNELIIIFEGIKNDICLIESICRQEFKISSMFLLIDLLILWFVFVE